MSQDQKKLFKAISLDLVDKLKAALAGGASVNAQHDDMTPLAYACDRRKTRCALELLAAGADVNGTCKDGTTALHRVFEAELAEELVKRGADLNAKSKIGWTPLHYAARTNRPRIVEVLLARRAQVDVQDVEGKTAYACADSAEIRGLLKKHGAKGFGDGGGRVLAPKKSTAKLNDVSISDGMGADREGRVWFAGEHGIVVLDGKKLTRYAFEESFSVSGIVPGPKGVVYLSTNWGLLRFDGKKFTLFSSTNSELFDNHVTMIATDPSGCAYLVHYEHGSEQQRITRFDGKSFTILEPGRDFPEGLNIECLGFDGAGKLVIGAEGKLAAQEARGWKVIEKFPGTSGFGDTVRQIVADGQSLWLVVSSVVLEGRGGKLTPHKAPELVNCLCRDGETTWIGLSYGGVAKLVNGKIVRLPGRDDANVAYLVRGGDGRVWASVDGELMYIEGGELKGLDGKSVAAAAPEPEEPPKAKVKAPKAPKKRKLVPFPEKPLVAVDKLPKTLRLAVEKSEIPGVTPAQLLSILRPALAIILSPTKNVPVGASKLGGRPDLPAGVPWPTYDDDEDRALPFILQIDLASVAYLHDLEALLPKKGMLFFFSDTAPDEIADARVVYSDKKPARRDFPEDLVDRAEQVDFIAQLPEVKITLRPIVTLPTRTLLEARAALGSDADEPLASLRAELGTGDSRILGWPDAIQDDVITSEHAISLLQLSGGAHEIFRHWCGDGLVHFVISAEDLAKKKFDRASAMMVYT
jgi:uncharacterized protein YwqG